MTIIREGATGKMTEEEKEEEEEEDDDEEEEEDIFVPTDVTLAVLRCLYIKVNLSSYLLSSEMQTIHFIRTVGLTRYGRLSVRK